MLKSLIWSTLNWTPGISFSNNGISLTPFLLPSVPKLLTFIKVIDFLTGSTSLSTPSYLTSALVISDILLPKILPDYKDPPVPMSGPRDPVLGNVSSVGLDILFYEIFNFNFRA